jgi:prophage DNA circulation protein
MVALSDLAPASFRGARFLCPRDHDSEGRQSILHLYPNKSSHYVEDNGQNPSHFTLTCVLSGPTLLSDWSRLRSALNTPGPGTLRHPWLGSKLCSVKGPWKVNREDRDSGVLELSVEFIETTDGPSFPSILGVGIAATVTSLVGTAVNTTFSSFVSQFSLPSNPASQAYVVGLMNNVGASVGRQFQSNEDVSTAQNFLKSGLNGSLPLRFDR